MQKISKQFTTFAKREKSLWLKKSEKTLVIKFEKKRGLGLTEIEFGSLFLNIKKHRHKKRVSLIY